MRLEVLVKHGGIYLDIDAFALKPFVPFLNPPSPRDMILGAEGGNRWGLCNAIMAARPGSRFANRWLESYKGADLRHEWNYHSVILPGELAEKHPGEVCALAPDAFFWPTWASSEVRWMHEPLNRKDAARFKERIWYNHGSFRPHQVAYHAWRQIAWKDYLMRLTPQNVREQDTRFNILVRRFIESDVS